MEKPKHTYLYEGPVYHFEDLITPKWKGTTQAISPGRAKTNFLFRLKRLNGFSPETKLTLDDSKIKKLN